MPRSFDDLFAQRRRREASRRYLEGLPLPVERSKALTGLANTEPVVGTQHPRAQGLQRNTVQIRRPPSMDSRLRRSMDADEGCPECPAEPCPRLI